jgi:histidinol-phosphate aminotransferase
MNRFSELLADHVRSLNLKPPSKPQPTSAQRVPRRIKLAANESPYGPSPKAVAAMRDAVLNSHLYPDDDALQLRLKLAEIHSVGPVQVIVSAGLTSLLTVIARILLQPGRQAVTSACSFLVYQTATRAVGAQIVETPTLRDGYDLDAIVSAIDDSTRVIFLANPNNPTGTLLDSPSVERFLDQVPAHVLVVIDEAYFDYAQHFGKIRNVQYSSPAYSQRDNVLVLRTFSKAHGLAGLRVGYGVGPAELIACLAQMQDMFSVSGIAQAAALAALEDTEHVRFAVESNAKQAEQLAREIASLGCRVVPTWTNFVCCDIGRDAAEVARKLRAEGIVILPLNAWGAPQCLRVTVGTAEQNQIFLEAFRKILS